MGQLSQDVQDGVSGEGRAKSLTSWGVSWTGGNADHHADSLMAPTRPRHCGNTGGGNPPSTTVPSVQHSSYVVFPERVEPAHSAVQERGKAEATAFGGGGVKGSYLKDVQLLKPP